MWYWRQRRWDRDQREDSVIEGGKLIRVWRDKVKTHPEICASCPSYQPRGSN